MKARFFSWHPLKNGRCPLSAQCCLIAILLLCVLIGGCSSWQNLRLGPSAYIDPGIDSDSDGIADIADNCPLTENKIQSDLDGNGWGDACDDMDGDGVLDDRDRWAFDPFNDIDEDNYGADPYGICKRVCETCKKLAEICLRTDNCPADPNDQADTDGDGLGDVCDADVGPDPPACHPIHNPCVAQLDDSAAFADSDGDRIADAEDLCPELPISQDPYPPVVDPVDGSVNHLNTDNDEFGDACDDDDDNDGVVDLYKQNRPNPCTEGETERCDDNCRTVPNQAQADLDCDGVGNVCDPDRDGDGYSDRDEISGKFGFVTLPYDADSDDDGQSDGPEAPGCPPGLTAGDPSPLGDPSAAIKFSVLAPDGRDVKASWMPEPKWDNGRWSHDHLMLTAELFDAAGNPLVYQTIRFEIVDAGRYPGVAVNSTEAVPEIDLSFDDARTSTQESFAGPASKATFDLYAWDFGAHGTIKAEAMLTDGSVLTAELVLPLDADRDRLPDAWELDPLQRAAGFDPYDGNTFDPSSPDSGADIDRSLDNLYVGDGLTNSEEYRGVVFDGPGDPEHRRLDPLRKNLFVRGDNFANSLIKNYTTAGVLPFSVDYAAVYGVAGGLSAFEEAGIDVHDVTGMASFSQTTEPPNIDILVVTNRTEKRPDGLIQTLPVDNSLGIEDGFINHPSTQMAHYWTWDLKGASYIGNSVAYAVSSGGTTATHHYHLCLMHYAYDRPYLNDTSVLWQNTAKNACFSPTYIDRLDPLDRVEDYILENGTGPDKKTKGKPESEDRCIANNQLDADRIVPDWKQKNWGAEIYMAGYDLSLFDAEADGFLENPPLDDTASLVIDTRTPQAGIEYSAEQVQLHTVLHEMGHAVGMDAQHTSDPSCLMYERSPDWDRAGHFSPFARSQILIHNK